VVVVTCQSSSQLLFMSDVMEFDDAGVGVGVSMPKSSSHDVVVGYGVDVMSEVSIVNSSVWLTVDI